MDIYCKKAGFGQISRYSSLNTRIAKTLEDNRYNVSITATVLGMGRTTLWRKMKSYGISSRVAKHVS